MATVKRKFKEVYYIYQTAPTFKNVGYCFSKAVANKALVDIIQNGASAGRIVTFTREELKRLGY